MIYDKIIEQHVENNLKELIRSGKLELIFSDIELLDEFNIKIKDGDFKLSIRNKYLNGASSKKIEHDPTIKLIVGTKFKYDEMLGLPITISDKPKIYKDADNKYNRDQSRQYMKTVRKFIKDNKSELEEYWKLNPDSIVDNKRLQEIEDMIRGKYE